LAIIRAHHAAFDEDVADRPVLLGDPGIHGRKHVGLADEVVLHGQDGEQQVAVRMRGRHGQGLHKLDG
jgi:hypothetical protein